MAEGEISYAGRGARARAELAAEIVRERMDGCGLMRADLIGLASCFGDDDGRWLAQLPGIDLPEVRLRLAFAHPDSLVAQRLTREVTALLTCGPAGGGGVRTQMRRRLGLVSCEVPRVVVRADVEYIN